MKIFTVLLFLICSYHAVAAEAEPEDLMGVGSTMTFTRPIEFGRALTKTFCNGHENILMPFSRGECCTLVRASPHSHAVRLTLRASTPRTVSQIDWRRTSVVIEAISDTQIRCRMHRITATYLSRAFGDAIEINRVVPPVELPDGDAIEL